MTNGSSSLWNETVWGSLAAGVQEAVGAIRVVQKVIPPGPSVQGTAVPAGEFDFAKMTISEGVTLPYIELSAEFSLTNGQVNDDATGSAAIVLAQLAAKNLALAEDRIILQGPKWNNARPPGVEIESGSAGAGVLGIIDKLQAELIASGSALDLTVKVGKRGTATNSGAPVLEAVTDGIGILTDQQQGPNWALITDTRSYGAVWGGVINGAPAYSVLTPLLAGGVYGTGAMPDKTGVLIALGGAPTAIYVGDDAVTEPTYKGSGGRYYFRTFERFQYVAQDPRAFVKLDFTAFVA